VRIWDNTFRFFRDYSGAGIATQHHETSLQQDGFERFMKEYEERMSSAQGSGNTKSSKHTGCAIGHSRLWYRWTSGRSSRIG
jgi:hypothetical protein